jgi:predicted RNA-binding Zn-ribbon protein involved in translation (DUF1610 family)
MQCPRCGAENREGSNFCRYCSNPFTAHPSKPDSGYIPTVPPPGAAPYYQPPPIYQTPPALPVPRPAVGHTLCPRCGSTSILKGSTPTWAVVSAVVGFFLVCFLSLFFLLIKDPNRCLNCGLEFK